MWYTVPESKEDQKTALDVIMYKGFTYDLSMDEEARKQMESLLEAYFDEKKFNEKAYDDLYQMYDENLEATDGKSKEKMFPGDHSYAAFKKEFEKLWKALSYNTLKLVTETTLNAEQDAELKQMEQNELEDLQKRTDKAFSAGQNLLKNEAALQKESEAVMNALKENKKHYADATLFIGNNRDAEFEFAQTAAKCQQKIANELDKKLDDFRTEYDQTLKTNQRIVARLDKYLDKFPDLVNYDPNVQKKINNYIAEVERLTVKKPEYDRMDQKACEEFHEQWYGYMDRVNKGCHGADDMLDQMSKLTESLKNRKQKLDEDQKELDERRKDFSNLTKGQKEALIQAQEELNKQLNTLQEEQKQTHKKLLNTVKNNKMQLDADQKKLEANMKNPNVSFGNGYGIMMRDDYVYMKKVANQKLQRLYADFKNYLEGLINQKNAHDREQREIPKRREEMADILEAVSNLPAKEHWYKAATPEPQIFTDVRTAVKDYLDDHDNSEKAKKAYDECRNYMATYMKADKSGLKSGSKTTNTRHQSVVRMLELMDRLPEFAAYTEKEKPQAAKDVDGWENLELEDVVKDTYTKLNFHDLENSLAKHSTSKKAKSQDPEKQKKAFSDLNRRIDKTKEQKANQQKNQGGNQKRK